MNDAVRVLMITSQYPNKERPMAVPFIVRQIEYLRSKGIDIDVFHFSGNKNFINYLKAWGELRKHTKGKKYDLVHAQWGHSAALALPKSLPWVITFRGNDLEGIVGKNGRYTFLGRVLQTVSKMMARLADEVIVVSESLGKRLPRNDYQVIPSGLDLELFRPIPRAEARKSLRLPEDKKLVLFAASTIENQRKRFDLAKKAVEMVKNRFDAELIVANKVPHTSIPYYMSACDALLLTSMHEGSPNVVKEALACNLPIVSVDVGDVRERIGKIDGCVVCGDDSPHTLAEGLARILSSENRLINGRDAVRDLDENVTSRRVIEVYKKALTNAGTERKFLTIGGEKKETTSRI